MAMVRIFLLMAALHSANVALAETEVKGRPALVLDGEAARVVGPSICWAALRAIGPKL